MARQYRGRKSRNNSSTKDAGAKATKRSSKGKRNIDDDIDQRGGTCRQSGGDSSLNDISWYSRNPNLLLAAGQFPYPYRPGMDLNLANPTSNTGSGKYQIPGVVTLEWVPSFGNSKSSTDPASIAGKEFYGRVRAAYSGSLDADAPDFMVYIGALDSLFSYIGWLKRVYRTISTYSAENYLLPDALLAAYGLTSVYSQQQLRQNKVALWQGINEMILMSRKFKCPAVMDLFNRHYWLSDNVYADAPSVRAQLYVFNLKGVYKTQQVKEASSNVDVQGLQLVKLDRYFSASQKKDVVQELLNVGFGLIQALDEWDDCYTISGYLQRAFDSVPSFSIAELEQGEMIEAHYVPEVLTQIENARAIIPTIDATGDSNQLDDFFATAIVTQNTLTNAVVSNVNFTSTWGTGSDAATAMLAFTTALPNGVQPCLNLHVENPTVADSVIASRLQACTTVTYTKPTTGTTATVKFDIEGGTELVVRIAVIRGNYSSDQPFYPTYISQVFPDNIQTADVTTKFTMWNPSEHLLEQFAMHPLRFAVTGQPSVWTVYPIGDTFNVTKFTREMLANLHKVCFYSELNSFSI